MKNRYVFSAIITLLLISVNLQVKGQNFYRSYGSEGNDFAQSVELTPDSGYVVAGATEGLGAGVTDGYVIKIDSLGELEWSRTYGGNNIDWITDIKIVADGYVMCGYSNSFSNGYDNYLIKTDFDGIVIWDTVFGGADWDFLYSIDINTAGNIVAVGKSYSGGAGQADGYVIEASPTGQIIDLVYLGNALNDHFNDVHCTADGGAILSGATSITPDDTDLWIVKIDAARNTVWEHALGDTLNDEAFHCAEIIPGTYIISGVDEVSTGTLNDHIMVKLDDAGVIEITNYLNQSADDIGIASISYANDDSYITIGNTTSFFHGETDVRAFSCHFNTFGSYVFTYDFGTNGEDFATAVDTTDDKGLVVVGTTEGTAYGFSNFFVHKVDSTKMLMPLMEDVDLSIATDYQTSAPSFHYASASKSIILTDPTYLHSDSYYIVDIAGRVILKSPVTDMNISVNLPTGVYVFTIGKETLKFVVE